jgi:5'-nucleotidase
VPSKDARVLCPEDAVWRCVYGPGGSTGPYPYTGNLRFDVNATRAEGSRVTSIEARNAAANSWGPLDLTKTYKLFV